MSPTSPANEGLRAHAAFHITPEGGRRGGAASISSSKECALHSVRTKAWTAGSAAAEPCARGHSFGTGARCDSRAAQRAALSQRMYRGLGARGAADENSAADPNT